MSHNIRILISIAAVTVFSFPAVAGPGPAGSDQLLTLPQNARVANGLTLSGQDSKNTDLAITARIRERIAATKDLSVNARNVKIITSGGRVVLKGTVITVVEKRLIGNIAIGVQRRENVDNQLVVRSSPSAPTGLRVIQ